MDNSEFVDTFFGNLNQPREVLEKFRIIKKLSFEYGNKLFSKQYLEQIWKVDEEVLKLIKILDKFDKACQKDVIEIMSLIEKKYNEQVQNVEVKCSKNISKDKFKKIVQEKIGQKNIKIEEMDWIWLEIDFNNWVYKRNLDKDLDKLLGNL